MWLLSSDGDALEGRRRWLRPGTSHLLGRTSNKLPSGEQTYLQHDSISRKHITLHIAESKAGDSTRVHSRSVITAMESSKKGTIINGQHYKGEQVTFDATKTKFTIQLALWPEKLKIEWVPVVLSIKGINRVKTSDGTTLAKAKETLEQSDIKLVADYLTNDTTHLVSKSRNTPPALQALLQARWVVGESFIDALAAACTARNVGSSASPLEDDFDGSWPKETEYILPAGAEPVTRPNHYLMPDKQRAQLFKDHTFIFLLQGQYDRLLPVVTAGSGKAILCEYQPGASAAADVIAFTKEFAGKKGTRRFLLSQETGPGIVLVRPEVKDDGSTDAAVNEIELAQNQRMVDQKSFLDAVLTKDTASFRRQLRNLARAPVDEEMQDIQTASSSFHKPPTASTRSSRAQLAAPDVDLSQSSHPTSQRTQPPPSSDQAPSRTQEQPENATAEQPKTRPRRRIVTTQSRAKFGDDYDPNQIIRVRSNSPDPALAPAQPSQAPGIQSIAVDKEPSQGTSAQRSSRKRSVPEDSEDEMEENEEQKFDRMYPNQAALKRQKREESKTGFKSFPKPKSERETTPVPRNNEAKAKKVRRRALEPEPEIKERLKARVKFDEEQRLDEEAKADMSTMTADDLKKIAEEHKDNMVVTFEVLALEQPRQCRPEINAQHPEWSGRQNFKKFRSNKVRSRRLDTDHERDDEGQRQLIALVPVPGKGRGTGDEYWLNRKEDKARSQHSQQQSQQNHEPTSSFAARRQAAAAAGEADVDDDEDDAHAFVRRIQRSREEDEENDAAQNALDDPVRGASELTRSNAMSTQTLRGETAQQGQRKVTGKRRAGELGAGRDMAPSAKKAKGSTLGHTTRTTSSRFALGRQDDDDEDDPTAFRRTRR